MDKPARKTYLKALLAGFILGGILSLACIGYLIGNEGLNRQDLAYVYLEPICITVAVLSTIALAAIWILTCVDAFLQRQWIWGIAILLFSWIPMLIYQVVEIRRLPSDDGNDAGSSINPARRPDDAVPRGTRDV